MHALLSTTNHTVV